MQRWYVLSDPAMEEALIEVPTIRRLAGIDLISERITDRTRILAFRYLLEKRDLGKKIYCFAEDCIYERVKVHIKDQCMAMKQATIIDATLIAAPKSTLPRPKAERAGGTRTKRAGEIPGWTRPVRASSGNLAFRCTSV